MKKLFFIIIIFIIGCNKPITKETDWEKNNLKGKVKTITETDLITFKTKDGNSITKPSFTRKTFYDNNGSITSIIGLGINQSEISKFWFTFDSVNKEIRDSSYDSFLGKNLSSIRKLDENYNLSEEESYSKGVLFQKELYQYNSNGLLSDITTVNNYNVLVSRQTFYYNQKGLQNESKEFNNKNQLESIYIKKYDSKNKNVEAFTFSADSVLLYKSTKKYDPYGNILEDENFTPSRGKHIRYSYQYTYDSLNNWTSRIVSADSIRVNNQTRKIEYYY